MQSAALQFNPEQRGVESGASRRLTDKCIDNLQELCLQRDFGTDVKLFFQFGASLARFLKWCVPHAGKRHNCILRAKCASFLLTLDHWQVT